MIFSAQALVKKLTQKYGLIIVLLSVVMFQLGNTQNRVNAASPNLMPNPSVESVNPARKTEPLYWHKDTWGSNTSTFTYKKVGHTGSRSVYINTTSYTNGDAKWLSDPVTVTPGETYTYSTYFKSNVRTELLARFTATDGSVSYKWLSGAGKSTSWKKLETQVNIPARTESITLLHILGGVGYLQTDDFSLTHNQPVLALPGQNIVANSSMEATADSVSPLRWQSNTAKVNDAVFSYPQVGHTGSRSGRVVIQNYTSGDAHWSADPQPVTGGKTYEFSNWYQSDVGTEVYAHIVLTDGTEVWKYIGSPLKSTGWNKFYTQFVMPANAVSADIYQTLFSVGYLQTDDYSLNEYQPSGFNRGLVSITFDDSIRSTYANGLPLLTQYGYKSTFYCLGGYLSDPYYMTPEMITELGRSGHEIGSHGMLHTSLVQSSPSQLMSELTTSRDALTNITG
nr:polysaccharide deacetylase family protein [Candidatus Saccharibacteria bacterium]